jgi:hypothetical protein
MDALDINKIDLALQMVSNYQQWGEWLAGLNLAAISAVALLYGLKEKTGKQNLSWIAMLSLGCFGLSVFMSTILVGNLNAIIVQFESGSPFSLAGIKSTYIPGDFPLFSVNFISTLAGSLFGFGSCLFALDTYLRHKK